MCMSSLVDGGYPPANQTTVCSMTEKERTGKERRIP